MKDTLTAWQPWVRWWGRGEVNMVTIHLQIDTKDIYHIKELKLSNFSSLSVYMVKSTKAF